MKTKPRNLKNKANNIDTIGQLKQARLSNRPCFLIYCKYTDTTIASLLGTIDHFIEHPDEYTNSVTVKIPTMNSSISYACAAALAQDSPETPTFYINQILGRLDSFKYPGMRKQIEEFLAEKKYLPEVKLLDNTGNQLDTTPVIVTNA